MEEKERFERIWQILKTFKTDPTYSIPKEENQAREPNNKIIIHQENFPEIKIIWNYILKEDPVYLKLAIHNDKYQDIV